MAVLVMGMVEVLLATMMVVIVRVRVMVVVMPVWL
jgi:hypothetical protein